MGQLRIERLQELIKQEISNILFRELKDPRIGFATITKVEVAGDLRHAKIFVSVMGSEQQKKETMTGLQNALGFLRSEISKRIRLRYIPELHLALDENLDYSVKINTLLEKVKQDQEAHGHE